MGEQKPTAQGHRASVAAIRDRPSAEVLVIGGGINGIATFRELALQGVDVVLVERGDFVSGASAASSHMIHGGVRYLENGEFRLVAEAVRERNRLLKNAPHYVRPLQTTIPVFSTFSGLLAAPMRFLSHRQRTTRERGALLIKVGLLIYDAFSRDGGSVPRHRFVGRKKALQSMPKLNPSVKYAATYFDASMHDPERLALDVLWDGVESGSGRASNYLEAAAAEGRTIILRDVVTGESFDLTAKVIINTTGPWTDLTNRSLGLFTRFMGGTKGSHIVLDNAELLEAVGGRELFFENNDGRIVLIYPLKGKVMVGTTEIDADPSKPAVCTDEEVDYFFSLIQHVLPSVRIRKEDIVYRFSGIRPLPRHDDEVPGFVSRDYRIEREKLDNDRTLLSLVGGKWTTFRALGEHMADEALKLIGKQRAISTRDMPIGGGRNFPSDPSAREKWITSFAGANSRDRVSQLLERYGTRAAHMLPALAGERSLLHSDRFSVEEIEYLVRHEQVASLRDVIYRRTNLAFLGELSPGLVYEIAEISARILEWSDAKKSAELAILMTDLDELHGVRIRLNADGRQGG